MFRALRLRFAFYVTQQNSQQGYVTNVDVCSGVCVLFVWVCVSVYVVIVSECVCGVYFVWTGLYVLISTIH